MTVCHLRFVFFATKQKKTLTLSSIKRKPVELPSIGCSNRTAADEQGRFHGPFLRLAVEALRDRVCACVRERKHAEPGGGCEKSVDVGPTGT